MRLAKLSIVCSLLLPFLGTASAQPITDNLLSIRNRIKTYFADSLSLIPNSACSRPLFRSKLTRLDIFVSYSFDSAYYIKTNSIPPKNVFEAGTARKVWAQFPTSLTNIGPYLFANPKGWVNMNNVVPFAQGRGYIRKIPDNQAFFQSPPKAYFSFTYQYAVEEEAITTTRILEDFNLRYITVQGFAWIELPTALTQVMITSCSSDIIKEKMIELLKNKNAVPSKIQKFSL